MRPPPSMMTRSIRLAVVLGVIGWVWLVFLPHWAQEPRMQAALKTHEDRQINGSATYYTENPAALAALRDMEQLERKYPGLWW